MDKKDLSGQFQVTLQFRINRDEMLRNVTTYNVRSWPFLWQLYVTLRRVEEGKEVWIDRLEIQTIKNQLHLSSSSPHKKEDCDREDATLRHMAPFFGNKGRSFCQRKKSFRCSVREKKIELRPSFWSDAYVIIWYREVNHGIWRELLLGKPLSGLIYSWMRFKLNIG